MRHYCTIFDKNYLFQGLAVYRSLKYSSKPYKFYPLCMDQESYGLIKKMDLENVIPLKVQDILTDELAKVQENTTKGQFCWVCQPIVCQYILEEFKAEIVIYLEADSMFFADPEILLDELGDSSVSLVPHNYSSNYDYTSTSGIYCVQFNAFKNDEFSKTILDYWKENCFKYSATQPHYFPGQLCLDNWTSFKGVKSLTNIGAGVAPWNSGKFELSTKNNQVLVDDVPVVFYHYHQYGCYEDGSYDLGDYPIADETLELIYKPYINELRKVENIVHQSDPTFNFRKVLKKEISIKDLSVKNIKVIFTAYINVLKRKIKNKKKYNIFPANYFDANH